MFNVGFGFPWLETPSLREASSLAPAASGHLAKRHNAVAAVTCLHWHLLVQAASSLPVFRAQS